MDMVRWKRYGLLSAPDRKIQHHNNHVFKPSQISINSWFTELVISVIHLRKYLDSIVYIILYTSYQLLHKLKKYTYIFLNNETIYIYPSS